MANISLEIEKRIEELKYVIEDKEKAVLKSPKGVINIAKGKKRAKFYYKKDSSSEIRKYLTQKDEPIIVQLCQKDYDQKILNIAQKELQLLERLKNKYPKEIMENVYDDLHIERQKRVIPLVIPIEEYVRVWEEVIYQPKSFRENSPEYYTDRGERVRSKTEILIANALYRHNVPYRYECPLYLKGYGTIHPDFTVLNVRLRKEMYWEHMGMMDDPDYISNALHKIDTYEKNNIFPGDQLILTHETSTMPISSRNIEKMISKYLQ